MCQVKILRRAPLTVPSVHINSVWHSVYRSEGESECARSVGCADERASNTHWQPVAWKLLAEEQARTPSCSVSLSLTLRVWLILHVFHAVSEGEIKQSTEILLKFCHQIVIMVWEMERSVRCPSGFAGTEQEGLCRTFSDFTPAATPSISFCIFKGCHTCYIYVVCSLRHSQVKCNTSKDL